MFFPNTELTQKGIDLLAEVTAGNGTLVFTKVKIGSGTYTGNIKDLIDLINEFHEFNINSSQVQGDSSVRITAFFNNSSFTNSYEWREIGIYARLGGDTQTEVLYSYTNGNDIFATIPAYLTSPYRHTLDIRNYISDAESVSFVITELTDRYDFNTYAEMIAATYLTDGDRINIWGATSQNDGIVEKRVVKVASGSDSILLVNGLYSNRLEYDFKTEIGKKLDKGDVSEDYNTAEKIEKKIKEGDNETVLFSGSSTSTGVITLAENWTNFKEILFIGSKNDDTNIRHNKVYVDYIIPSDATVSNSANEYTIYSIDAIFKSLCFRETNKDELYVTEGTSCKITKIIGIGVRREI